MPSAAKQQKEFSGITQSIESLLANSDFWWCWEYFRNWFLNGNNSSCNTAECVLMASSDFPGSSGYKHILKVENLVYFI